jgi:uncharacterized protein
MMEFVTVGNVLVLVVGIAIGVAAGYVTFPQIRQARVLREQLDQALKQHEDYRASVNSHFRKTADLVGEMTRSYAAVYDHLATGARTFCDGKAADEGSRVAFGPLPGALASPVIETTADEAPAAEAAATAPADTTPAPVEAATPVVADGSEATASDDAAIVESLEAAGEEAAPAKAAAA